MLAAWRTRWRRRQEAAALQRRAIPDDLWKRVLVRYPFLQRKRTEDAAELRRLTSLFLDRKEFTAAGGLRLTDAMAVSIAAQAVLPVLKLGLHHYDGFVGLVVHADQVVARREVEDDDGVVHVYDEPLAGEAMQGGPIMLSWRDVREAQSGARLAAAGAPAYNVVIHEFVHALDMEDGLPDGVPLLPSFLSKADWVSTLQQAQADLVQRLAAGEATAIDPYGTESLEEFFAVASEAFFVNSHALQDQQPALYSLFTRFYCQDPTLDRPASRSGRSAA